MTLKMKIMIYGAYQSLENKDASNKKRFAKEWNITEMQLDKIIAGAES